MSDAAITAIVSGVITVAGMVVGFLTLWVKIKYGVEKVKEVESKVDANTVLTGEARSASVRASEHTASCDEDRARILKVQEDHGARITALEAQMTAIGVKVDGVDKNINSTRHEVRGHLQTITNSITALAMKSASNPMPPAGDAK